jgi:hypothetical protein
MLVILMEGLVDRGVTHKALLVNTVMEDLIRVVIMIMAREVLIVMVDMEGMMASFSLQR